MNTTMRNSWVYIVLLVLLPSCQPVLKAVWGVNKPKYETKASLKAYLKSAGFSPRHSYILDSLDWNKIFYNKDRTFPDLLLFDTAGNRISEKGLCIPYSQNFVDTLISVHNRNFIKTNSQPTFGDFEKMFRNYSCQKVALHNNERYKAILIWAVFIGNRKGLRQLKKVVYYVKHSKYPIELYFLNLDLQSCWRKKIVNTNKQPGCILFFR